MPHHSSLVKSEKHQQTGPMEDVYQRISWTIHDDLQLTFLVDTTKVLEEQLTLDDIDDLRLVKFSHRCSLTDQQWMDIRTFFHELIRQAKCANSLDLIVRLLQERLSDMDRENHRSKQNHTFRRSRCIRRASLNVAHAHHSKHIPTDPNENSSLAEGLYCFDHSIDQWISCPCLSMTADNVPQPSMEEMRLPQHCQIVTWHLLPDQCPSPIFERLESILPDLVCLQGVTSTCLDHLLDQCWLKENNYYLIITRNVLNQQQQPSDGQVMLMKNFRPRAFSVCPLYSLDDSSKAQKLIIARFGLNATVTVDVVSVHLPDKDSLLTNEQRCRAVEYLFKTMQQKNYMLIGDFSFGDVDVEEYSLMERYQYQIHDLWKEIYDLEQNPGLTFDPGRKDGARRSDRFLLHTLYNLTYSIEYLDMIHLDDQSAHHPVKLVIHFHIRSSTDRSVLAIVPPREIWSHFGSLDHTIPHMKLIQPFFLMNDVKSDDDNDQHEKILLPLRLLLAQYEPFDLEMFRTDASIEQSDQSIRFYPSPCACLEELHERIRQLLLPCLLTAQQFLQTLVMHIRFNQGGNNSPIRSAAVSSPSWRLRVQSICLLQRADDNEATPFDVLYELPLGSTLPPIGSNPSDRTHSKLEEFFHQMNLYQSRSSSEQKQDKFDRLSQSFARIFNAETLHRFTTVLLPYGSFRLGLDGDDLDTVFILSECSNINTKTSFDQTLLQLRYDRPAFHAHVTSLLEKQILRDFGEEILYCQRVQALIPIMSLLFNDQTRVEIFVQIKLQSIPENNRGSERSLVSDFDESIHGVHDAERLIASVRFPVVFQHLLAFIRIWAQRVGLYGQVFSYLGGFSWAILCAYICHTSLSSAHRLCSTEQFFRLVKTFFSFYAQFDWSSQSLRLQVNSSRSTVDSEHQPEFLNRGAMRILCPSPPFVNSSRSTIKTTRQLLIEAFQEVSILLGASESNEECLRRILSLPGRFPHRSIQSIIQLRLSGRTLSELMQWIGWVKSRLARFLAECEDDCGLFVQTQHTVEFRGDPLERFYCIGFTDDVRVLSQHGPSKESLDRFFDQVRCCSYRTGTMKLSYKFLAIADWLLQFERNEVVRIEH